MSTQLSFPLRAMADARAYCRTGLFAALFVAGSGLCQAESLVEAVNSAVSTNPEVLGARASSRAAAQDIKEARAGYLPSVDIRAGYGSEHTNIKQLKRAGTALGTLGKREIAFSVNQMLFDGFGTRSEVEQRIELLNAAENSISDTLEAVAFRTVESYLEVLRNQELLQLAVNNVRAHQETLKNVRTKVESGLGTSGDLQQAEGRIALARSIRAAREGQLKQSLSSYERVVGHLPADLSKPQRSSFDLVREDKEDSQIDETRLDAAIEQALDFAFEQHPALKSADARSRAAEAAVENARAGYYPRVDLEMNVTRDNNVSGVDGIRNTESLMVVARWNLFQGGADRARIDSLSEQRVVSLQDIADVKRAIKENVEVALKAKATTELRLQFLAAHVSASVATLESYKSQFRLGKRTLLDLLNAENELFTARSNEVAGLYDDLVNQYFIEASKGGLISSLGVTP